MLVLFLTQSVPASPRQSRCLMSTLGSEWVRIAETASGQATAASHPFRTWHHDVGGNPETCRGCCASAQRGMKGPRGPRLDAPVCTRSHDSWLCVVQYQQSNTASLSAGPPSFARCWRPTLLSRTQQIRHLRVESLRKPKCLIRPRGSGSTLRAMVRGMGHELRRASFIPWRLISRMDRGRSHGRKEEEVPRTVPRTSRET